MANYFEGHTCDEAWLRCVEGLCNSSESLQASIPSRNGDTIESLHTLISVDNSHDRYILSRYPAISISFALAEVIWILNGENQAEIINYWNSSLPKYSGKTLDYPGAYGYRLSKIFGFNQIKEAYLSLIQDQVSRRVVLLIWNPLIDFPQNQEIKFYDTPCNICSMLKIRNGKLFWSQIMRSNDIYLGTPYNLIQFTILHELFTSWLKLELGTYSLYCDSLHAYTRDLKFLKKSLDHPKYNPEYPTNQDYFNLPYEETMDVVQKIYTNMKRVVNSPLSMKDHQDMLDEIQNSIAWQNIYRVIMAYAANKQNDKELINMLISGVTNPLLQQAWKNWKNRRNNHGR